MRPRCDDCQMMAVAAGKCSQHFANLTGGPTYSQLRYWLRAGYVEATHLNPLRLSVAQLEHARAIHRLVQAGAPVATASSLAATERLA